MAMIAMSLVMHELASENQNFTTRIFKTLLVDPTVHHINLLGTCKVYDKTSNFSTAMQSNNLEEKKTMKVNAYKINHHYIRS